MAKQEPAKMAKTIQTLEKNLEKLTTRFDKFERFEDSWERDQVQERKKLDRELNARIDKLESELRKGR